MTDVQVTIDGQTTRVEAGATVLQAARSLGIRIPTLCYHPALKPSGSCRLCAVEIVGVHARSNTMLSCVLKVRDGLEARTTGEKVEQARARAFRNLLQMAPESRTLRMMAEEYGVGLGPPPDGCIRCRLCVRVCKEIVGAEALNMETRDHTKYVVPDPGRCIGCGTCANICPTGAIRMTDEDGVRTISIRDETIGKHPLRTCEGCGKRFATPRFLDYIGRRTDPHVHVKEEHRYCPTCAKLLSNRVRSFDQSARTRS
jgi:bidirectional [NiFe] hydrogenase diaphorase subunit